MEVIRAWVVVVLISVLMGSLVGLAVATHTIACLLVGLASAGLLLRVLG